MGSGTPGLPATGARGVAAGGGDDARGGEVVVEGGRALPAGEAWPDVGAPATVGAALTGDEGTRTGDVPAGGRLRVADDANGATPGRSLSRWPISIVYGSAMPFHAATS
jgi:hypothetical protein